MNSFDDDQDMHAAHLLDDAAVELILAGRAAADDDLSALTAFVAEMRTSATMPPPAPSAALAAVLTAGLTAIDLADVAAATPTSAARPVRRIAGLVHSRRQAVSDFGSRRALRMGAAGVAAKIAFGCSVAAASVTAAGAAGVLPDPIQHAVAGVVRAVSPFEFPDPASRTDAGRQPDPDRPHQNPAGETPSSTDQNPRPAGELLPSDPGGQPHAGTDSSPGAPDVMEADPDRTDRSSPPTVPGGTPGTGPYPAADAPYADPLSGGLTEQPTSQPPDTPITQPAAPSSQPGNPAPQPEDTSAGAPETPPTTQPPPTSTTQPQQLPTNRR